MIKIIKKFVIGLSYFLFWLIDGLISIQMSEWISLPSSDTSDPSMKALWLGNTIDLVTSIILSALFCLIIKRLNFNDETKKSWGFWINIITITLMFIAIIFSNFGGPLLISNAIDSLATILVVLICFFTVGLGVFDFYKLLRTWNIRWYHYGIILQGLAMIMILFGLATMC